jgi:hypothetical protein
MYLYRFVRTARCGSYAAWNVISAKTASLTSSACLRASGSSERPRTQSGDSMPSRSQMVGKMSTCDTSASDTRPPVNPPGPRTISRTPIPRSVSVAFAPGNANPWSVVKITSVFSSSIASSTVPTPWSSARALAL